MSPALQRTYARLRHLGRSYLARSFAPKPNTASPDPQPYAALVQLLLSFDGTTGGADVLYFGDSVVERVAREDQDQRTLGEMVQDRLRAQRRVVVLSLSAYNAEMYRLLLLAVANMASHPGLVIVPINMRSFSPQWDRNPNWQFSQERALLQRYTVDAAIDIKLAPDQEPTKDALEAYDAVPVTYPLTCFDRIGQFRLVINARAETAEQRRFRTKQIFIFHYMFALAREHWLIDALHGVIDIANSMQTKVMFYTTPINYQAGMRYVGPEFADRLAENVRTVCDAVTRMRSDEGPLFLDYSQRLGSEYFFHYDLATEHLNQDGRRALTEEIAACALDVVL